MPRPKKPKKYPLEFIGALADVLERDFLTIHRWIESSDVRLTTDAAKAIFKKYKIPAINHSTKN